MSVSPYRTPARSKRPPAPGDLEVPPHVVVLVIALVMGILFVFREPRRDVHDGSRVGIVAHSSAHAARGRLGR